MADCTCPNCKAPMPEPTPVSLSEAQELNMDYQFLRRVYRSYNPSGFNRDELVAREKFFGTAEQRREQHLPGVPTEDEQRAYETGGEPVFRGS